MRGLLGLWVTTRAWKQGKNCLKNYADRSSYEATPLHVRLRTFLVSRLAKSSTLALVLNKTRSALASVGLIGGTEIGVGRNGNALVRLNRDSVLGKKGSLIQLPKDDVMFRSVVTRGSWSRSVSSFLIECFDDKSEGKAKYAVFDIGANVGLVALQSMNLSARAAHYYLFEPIKTHVEALKHNVGNSSKPNIVTIIPSALGDKNKTATIFTETNNRGNSSLFQNVVPLAGRFESVVTFIDSSDFFENFEPEIDIFSIKCDAQGMDAAILSRIPKKIWSRTRRAVIEIWALPEIDPDDVRRVLNRWNHFQDASWSPNFHSKLRLGEVREFWLSGTSETKDLFLRRD